MLVVLGKNRACFARGRLVLVKVVANNAQLRTQFASNEARHAGANTKLARSIVGLEENNVFVELVWAKQTSVGTVDNIAEPPTAMGTPRKLGSSRSSTAA